MVVEYKNIDDQINMIKDKNILIRNEKKAKDILLRENYYNLITGYKNVFIDIKNNSENLDKCSEETYFEEIYAVYKFDRELKNIMLNYISIVEINIKSFISNIFSAKYGIYNYLDEKNFNINYKNKYQYYELIRRIDDNLKRNIENDNNIKEYKNKYNTIPLWMLSTHITFGAMIKFYSLMKVEDKKQVANLFKINYKDMEKFLKILNIIRNISAHNNILFNVRLPIKYPIKTNSYFHDKLNINKINNIYENGIDDILAVIIILERFLENSDYKKMIGELSIAIKEVAKALDNDSFNNFLNKMGIGAKSYLGV